jgi:hypothetical protein
MPAVGSTSTARANSARRPSGGNWIADGARRLTGFDADPELDASIVEQVVTPAELERARASLAGGIVLGLEDTGSRMVRLGRSQITGTPLLDVDDVLARIDAVDHDDVAAAARAVLSGPFTLALVGPVDDVDVDALADQCAAA